MTEIQLPNKPTFNPGEVAEFLGYSPSYVYLLIKRGEISAIVKGRRLKIPRCEVCKICRGIIGCKNCDRHSSSHRDATSGTSGTSGRNFRRSIDSKN
jgi:excisionase family DNA binding protein